MPILLLLLLILLLNADAYSNIKRFITYSKRINYHQCNSNSNSNNVVEDGVNLSCLNDNINNDAAWLGESIETWLNTDWMKLSIHTKIGNIVKDVYVNARKNDVNDLGEMLMVIASTLEDVDLAEAFVNPFDIANKASDLLMLRMNRELCNCAGDLSSFSSINTVNTVNVPISSTSKTTKPIPVVDINKNKITKLSQYLQTEFNRYQFIRDFLEGDEDITWNDVHVVIALVLGFRIDSIDNSCKQNDDYAPIGWSRLTDIPDFASEDPFMDERLQRDMPDEEEAVDIVVETIIGTEMLKIMKQGSADIRRRILVSKWLYVHGFLTYSDFPIKTKIDEYPQHLSRD